MNLHFKRVYAAPAPDDGLRILVDRLWPRGLSKAQARIDWWAKDIAPSHDLRRWYNHDPEKWEVFRRRYFAELDALPEAVADCRARLEAAPVATLLTASREERLNHAVALRDYLVGAGP
jgi:uncharacterized protein YeaO (DUF488 family)